MTNDWTTWLMRLFYSLPVRIGLAVLTSLTVAAAIPLLFLANQLFMPVVVKLAAVFGLGLVCGLAARNLIDARYFLVRLATSLISLISGLLLLARLTSGYIGLYLPHNLTGIPDWSAAGQLLMGGTTVFLVLRAWKPAVKLPKKPNAKPRLVKRQPVKVTKQYRKVQPPKTRPNRVTSRKTVSKLPLLHLVQRKLWQYQWTRLDQGLRRFQPRVNSAVSASRRWASDLWTGTQVKIRDIRQARNAQIRMREWRSQTNPARRMSQHIHLRSVEEHRCPYCLEEVKKSDPRGIKICPVCRTYHHADCWAVTDNCQVPHQHE